MNHVRQPSLTLQQITLLRRLTEGALRLTPSEAGSTEEQVALDADAQQLVDWHDEGLVELMAKPVRNSMSSTPIWYLVLALRLTDRGRALLEAHSGPATAARQTVRETLVVRLATLKEEFARSFGLVRAGLIQRGMLVSSLYQQAVAREADAELLRRASTATALWLRVSVGQQLMQSAGLEAAVRDDVDFAIRDGAADVSAVFARAVQDAGSLGWQEQTLEAIVSRCREAALTEWRFAQMAPEVPHSNPPPGPQLTFNAPVNSVQVGDGTVSNAQMQLNSADAQVLTLLQELLRLVSSDPSVASDSSRTRLVRDLQSAMTEATQAKPNWTVVGRLVEGAALFIQTASAAPGALEVAHKLMGLLKPLVG